MTNDTDTTERMPWERDPAEITADTHERRRAFLDGLLAMHQFLTEHPEHMGTYPDVTLHAPLIHGDLKQQLATAARDGARAKGVTVRKQFGQHAMVYFDFGGRVEVAVYASREQVCERRQVGTTTISEPDPEAVDALPKVEREVPVYEWDCPPLLASDAA